MFNIKNTNKFVLVNFFVMKGKIDNQTIAK